MNSRMPGHPVHHQLPDFTQTHVHWVGNSIQPSHPPSSSSLPALNLSQHHGLQMSQLFTSGGQSTGVSASQSVLSGLISFRIDWLHLLANRKRSMSRLYIVTLLIQLMCRVHHEKCWAGGSKSRNQDCWEKYQQPQICRWHHPYGRKWRRTKEPLDVSETGEWKSWLKAQHSEN